MKHVVGGIAVEVDGALEVPADARPFFAVSDESAAITLKLVAEPVRGAVRPAGTPVIEKDSWAAFRSDGGVQLCAKDTRFSPQEQARIELAPDQLRGRYVYGSSWPYFVQFPMDQLLVIHALGVAGGALMHAAAICGRDGALLVSGPSGAGKTTMSRACAALGASVLSDERTIARPDGGGGWLLGGTPWPGEGGFAENRSVPLRALIVLEQAARNELVPLAPARALALLYRCHFPPLWDPVAAERTLGHLERLVREVPAFLFRNHKGADAARLLLDRVGGVAAAPRSLPIASDV